VTEASALLQEELAEILECMQQMGSSKGQEQCMQQNSNYEQQQKQLPPSWDEAHDRLQVCVCLCVCVFMWVCVGVCVGVGVCGCVGVWVWVRGWVGGWVGVGMKEMRGVFWGFHIVW